MSLKNFFNSYKAILYTVFGIFFILEVIVYIGLHYTERDDITDYLHAETLDTNLHIKMAVLQMNKVAQIFYDKDINKPKVIDIMYKASKTKDEKELTKLRAKLYNMLDANFKYYQKNNVRQFHFHLPNSISFLRFHKPKKFGDSLVDIRESIDYVNEVKIPISCYEEGRIFNGFRNVFPLFKGDVFVGTVEISYSFLALQNELLKMDSSSYLYLVSEKIAKRKLFKSALSNYVQSEFNGFLYDKSTFEDIMEFRLNKLHEINKNIAKTIQRKLFDGKGFSIRFSNKHIYNNKTIVITFSPVKNINSKTGAYIIHYKFDKFLELLLNKINVLFGILSIINILICLIIVMYLVYTKKKHEIIQQQATHDSLTKIYNRYGINDILKSKIDEYIRYNKMFSVIFFDIDLFKKVNDKYGHDIGDFVLENIATIVLDELRSSDAFGRWGGEEFIIILPETSLEHAINVAQKLRKTIEMEAFGDIEKITCSFGVTIVTDGDNITSLLKRVDKNLYKAKNAGRNKVIGQ